MIASETDRRACQKVVTDMLVYKKAIYLLMVYYASSYAETDTLAGTTSSDMILHLRSIFARHGIPKNVVSDNGLHYASHELQESGFRVYVYLSQNTNTYKITIDIICNNFLEENGNTQ